MQVKICEGSDNSTATDLEEKIRQTVNEMQEKGFYLKHISYSSSFDYDNNYAEKTAILIFDNDNNL